MKNMYSNSKEPFAFYMREIKKGDKKRMYTSLKFIKENNGKSFREFINRHYHINTDSITGHKKLMAKF